MKELKRKVKKLIFTAPTKGNKWMICIRFPTDIKIKLKAQAEKDYIGRGKQSLLIEDAIKYYLFTCSDIKWEDALRDQEYAELLDDIHEGLNQRPLEGATQVFVSLRVKKQLLDLEKKIRSINPMMQDIRTGLIRKAVSIRLSVGDKAFFDSIIDLNTSQL